jgi:hypothetical protein
VDLVPESQLTGPRYTIEDAVPTDGFLASVTIRSDWTEGTARFARRADLVATKRELRLTGRASPRARQELAQLGWALQEQASEAISPVTR